MESEVVKLARRFKRELKNREDAQVGELLSAWIDSEKRLDAEITLLARQISDIIASGGQLTGGQIVRATRLPQLLQQLRAEIDRYSRDSFAPKVANGQRELFTRGVDDAIQMLETSIDTPIRTLAGFVSVHPSAFETLVGLAADGTPLANLLAESFGAARVFIGRTLSSAISLGWNPRKTARAIQSGVRIPADRALTIARTEQLRAYRIASHEQYQKSGVVIGYKRLSAHDDRVCPACIAADGMFLGLDKDFQSHVNCRCVAVPVVSGEDHPNWLSGEDWFATQSKDTQQTILGPTRYEAWSSGTASLKDFMKLDKNSVWGDAIITKPIKEMDPELLPAN